MRLGLFNKWCRNFHSEISWISLDSPLQSRKISKKPMKVASRDEELHEDFLSGEELASAPDDSEVPKDPRMTYQTPSASSHAETPAAMTKSNRVYPQHVHQPYNHPPYSSHRRRSHQRYHRQTHHLKRMYLQSQCLNLEQ